MKNFIQIAKEEFARYANQYSFLGFFLWGVSLTLFSSSSNPLLRFLFFLILHLLAVAPFYIGLLKNSKEKRSILGIILGIFTIFLTLTIDTLTIIGF